MENFIFCAVLAAKKSCSVESGDSLAKLSILLKIYLFAWNIEIICILIKETESETPQIRFSGKDSYISLGYGGVPLWYLLDSWENDGILLYSNNWHYLQWSGESRFCIELSNISRNATVVLAPENLSSRKVEPVLISLKNLLYLRFPFSSRTSQPMPPYGDLTKKNTFFTENLAVAASERCSLNFPETCRETPVSELLF